MRYSFLLICPSELAFWSAQNVNVVLPNTIWDGGWLS